MSLKKLLSEISKKLNIDLIGVVTPEILEEDMKTLYEREKNFLSTDFEDKNLENRINPKLHMENVKSIIVIGMSYNYFDLEEIGDYRISNHARGYDYHQIVRHKLEKLKDSLSEYFEFEYKIQVDTGSLLERAYGHLAGLGYYGKNSCLINEKYGSYFSLGLLLSTIPFNFVETVLESECGNCKICINSCPSGAILGDYTINSKICHSYVTQNKETKEELKNIKYAYGCDICQRVCPKNLEAKKVPYTYDVPIIQNFNIQEIREISNNKFKKKYKDYSFSWINRKTILRNLEILNRDRD